ncbi:Fur family transcriptional regulator [Synoicihabitans lomoniglobus]|uniref:Transcriptional repressor n=1 Tax=Synoicihabitans lomoniglobus TaxID=2909285 RepID=A0AAF0CPV0_9BACT|nr:transcriptional repressor [Opitutaceae bacterium LMO-M01]WED65837.1 transcriptional repressor [Opitutaceae bacterium LMO-M01]
MTAATASPDPLSHRLTACGLRPTAQRETVFQVLLSKRDHPTADEVFARVKEVMPTISLATVYNCLEALVQHELVRAVNFERAPTRYCPNLHPHAHFHDEAGRTLDIELPPNLLEQLRSLLPTGYAAKHIEINFHGHTTES